MLHRQSTFPSTVLRRQRPQPSPRSPERMSFCPAPDYPWGLGAQGCTEIHHPCPCRSLSSHSETKSFWPFPLKRQLCPHSTGALWPPPPLLPRAGHCHAPQMALVQHAEATAERWKGGGHVGVSASLSSFVEAVTGEPSAAVTAAVTELEWTPLLHGLSSRPQSHNTPGGPHV